MADGADVSRPKNWTWVFFFSFFGYKSFLFFFFGCKEILRQHPPETHTPRTGVPWCATQRERQKVGQK
jgi:hypothetical protein